MKVDEDDDSHHDSHCRDTADSDTGFLSLRQSARGAASRTGGRPLRHGGGRREELCNHHTIWW